MALYSKNTGHWRTSAKGSLMAHRPTTAKIGEAHGKPIDGRLELSTVQHGGNRRCKRVTRIPLTRNETRMTHTPGKNAAKNARKRAAKRAARIAQIRGQRG